MQQMHHRQHKHQLITPNNLAALHARHRTMQPSRVEKLIYTVGRMGDVPTHQFRVRNKPPDINQVQHLRTAREDPTRIVPQLHDGGSWMKVAINYINYIIFLLIILLHLQTPQIFLPQ